MPANRAMMVTTTSISMSVTPRWFRVWRRSGDDACCFMAILPLFILVDLRFLKRRRRSVDCQDATSLILAIASSMLKIKVPIMMPITRMMIGSNKAVNFLIASRVSVS